MYIGIGPEYGKHICEEDAFPYVCYRIFSESQEERETAMQIFRDAGSISEAADRLTEWFFSGSWIREGSACEEKSDIRKIDNLVRIFWIRVSDGRISCCAGSYKDAVEKAEEQTKGTELTYVIF